MIIDAHTHVGKVDDKVWNIDELLHSMDEAGIATSLIIASEYNEASTESILAHIQENNRLKVIGDIMQMYYSEEYIQRRLQQLEAQTIVGLKFYLGYEDYSASDNKWDALYEYCQTHQKPVVFHTGLLEVGYKGRLKQSHPLAIDDVAYKFPDLKIVIAHLGNPWLFDAASVVLKNPHVYADVSGFFTEYQPIPQEEKDFFLQQMKELRVFMGGFDKLLFGTDFPLYSQKEYLAVANELHLENEEKERFFWKNAKTIFNL